MSTWTSQAGPRQTKAVDEARRKLDWRGRSFTQLSGVVGGQEHECELTSPFSPPCETCVTAQREIGERFSWTITRANYKEVEAAFTQAAKDLELPVRDERISQDEHLENERAHREREAKQSAEADRVKASHAAIEAKRPAWAAALIVAELHENQSDSMSDYFAHSTGRTVAIGWRRGTREDFQQLRAAAGTFEETKHLGPGCETYYAVDAENRYLGEDGRPSSGGKRQTFPTEREAQDWLAGLAKYFDVTGCKVQFDSVEHRENYSMGAGNYLKAGGTHSTGWSVKSSQLGHCYHVVEDHLPDLAAVPAVGVPAGGYAIEKHHHTKRGFDMFLVVLADRVERDVFERLRASCETAGGWYSRAWGRTPGGFAFKSEDSAKTWANCAIA